MKDNFICPKCGEKRLESGEDVCLGHLPGVRYACCGHGDKKKSYIQFENGIVVEGFSSVRKNPFVAWIYELKDIKIDIKKMSVLRKMSPGFEKPKWGCEIFE